MREVIAALLLVGMMASCLISGLALAIALTITAITLAIWIKQDVQRYRE